MILFQNKLHPNNPIITISLPVLTLNTGFMNAAKEKIKKYVIPYYLKEQNIIVLKFTDNINDLWQYKISIQGKLGKITMDSFFKNFRLNSMQIKGRYLADLEKIIEPDLGTCWIIDLNNKIST